MWIMARDSKKCVGSPKCSKKSKSPLASSTRKSVRLNKRAMNDLRDSVKNFLDRSVPSSACKADVNERKGDKIKKKRKKDNIVTIIDENVLNEDFIPLSFSEPSKKSEELKCSEVNVDETEPPTIVIEDDENDIIADVSTCESVVNDSIQIIGENQQSNPRKRKLNESIEICYEAYDGRNHVARKSKAVPSGSKGVISKTSDVILKDQDTSACQKIKDAESDDEIVVIDPDIDSENITVLKDIPQQNNSSGFGRKKERKKVERTNGSKQALMKPTTSFVFEDSQGTSNKSATYKSPLTSSSDKSYFNETGNNIYNPNNNVKKTGLRPVIIDGCNVAYGHGGNVFSARGVEICVNYFVKRGHMVRAFLPRFRRNEVSDNDRKILDDLHTKQQLSFTPSRYLHGRCVASYDDRFIVQCAAELGGVIVSTDNYRDLLGENESWRETIEKRLLMFTWVNDILMFPDDPLGRNGPRLEEFLRFPE